MIEVVGNSRGNRKVAQFRKTICEICGQSTLSTKKHCDCDNDIKRLVASENITETEAKEIIYNSYKRRAL